MAVFGLVLASLIALLALVIWMLYPNKQLRLIKKLPGPPEQPFFGHALLFKPDGVGFYAQTLEFCDDARKDGLIKGIIGPFSAFVGIFKAQHLETLLNSSRHMTKSMLYDFIHPWLGTGLLTSTGDKWRTRRRLLTPSFHFRILSDFLSVFNEQSLVMVARLKREVVGKGQFDIFNYVTLCALDIICDTAMGKNVNAQGNTDSEYVKAIYDMSEIIQRRQKQPWLWPNFIFKYLPVGRRHDSHLKILHNFTETVIRQRSAEYDQLKNTETSSSGDSVSEMGGAKKRLAFLDMLLDANHQGAGLSFLDIREEVDTFMFEGHDTTAAAINWAVHLLGANPDVQKRAQDEVDSVIGDGSTEVTMEHLKSLRYLECVIKESLRLFPSVPMFGRVLSEDVNIGGFDIAKGTQAVVMTSALHRDPDYFPDPEKFDPDRWLPEKSAGRHPYCYIPFSAGLRNCIGQKFAMNEEKVMLSFIVRNFRIESCQTREELRPTGELILRPENGIFVKLTSRNNN